MRGLREGVTGSAAADAFLSAADPLRAGPLTQAGQNVFYHSAEIAQENSGSVHKETTTQCYTFTRSFLLKGACSLYEPTHLCRTFPQKDDIFAAGARRTHRHHRAAVQLAIPAEKFLVSDAVIGALFEADD